MGTRCVVRGENLVFEGGAGALGRLPATPAFIAAAPLPKPTLGDAPEQDAMQFFRGNSRGKCSRNHVQRKISWFWCVFRWRRSPFSGPMQCALCSNTHHRHFTGGCHVTQAKKDILASHGQVVQVGDSLCDSCARAAHVTRPAGLKRKAIVPAASISMPAPTPCCFASRGAYCNRYSRSRSSCCRRRHRYHSRA